MMLTLRDGALLVMLLGLPATAAAQARLHGTIRDSTQGTPLPLVEVLVEGMNLSVRTDETGRYSLTVPLGFQTVVFRRVGYHPVTRQVRLSTTDSLRLDIAMVPAAQRLDSVAVSVIQPRSWPPGFDERKREGFGKFIDDSTLRRFEHTTLAMAILQRASSVRFTRRGYKNIALGRGGCPMGIVIDGLLTYRPVYTEDRRTGRIIIPMEGPGSPPDFDRLLSVVAVEAVEVYNASGIPSQYRTDGTACGVIVIWTRRQR